MFVLASYDFNKRKFNTEYYESEKLANDAMLSEIYSVLDSNNIYEDDRDEFYGTGWDHQGRIGWICYDDEDITWMVIDQNDKYILLTAEVFCSEVYSTNHNSLNTALKKMEECIYETCYDKYDITLDQIEAGKGDIWDINGNFGFCVYEDEYTQYIIIEPNGRFVVELI